MANIFPVFLIRAEDDLIALHIALKLSEQIPTALWRPGGPEGSLDGLAVVDADDLWNAALKARNYALALVYAGEEGSADFVVRGSTGCRTYGIYRDLLKIVEKAAADIATQALEWQSGEARIDVERRDGEFPSPIVVIPKGVDMKKLANKLKPYKPILHRDLAGGFVEEIMPWVKRKWPKRGVVIVPNEAEALEGLLVYVTPQDLDSIDKKIKEILSKSPCVFGEFKEPAEFDPKDKLKPLSDEWVNRLAQGVPCNHKTLCLHAIKRWPRLAYFLRDFHEPDKLAALALWNEGQLVEVLKTIAAGERKIELPDYTGNVISSLLRSGAVEAQTRAAMRPRKPPLVDVFGYRAVTFSLIALAILGLFAVRYTFGLSLALPAIYMLIWPDVMLAWIYSMAGVGVEPRLYYLGRGVHRDVFGRTHVVHRASPRVSALNMAAQSAYDLYRSFITSVSLSPDEILEVRYTKDRMFLRYTGNRWNDIRGDLERHFVLFEPAALTQTPLPDRPIRIFNVVFTAIGVFAVFAAFGAYTVGMLAYPLVGPILKRRARAYAAAPPMRSLTRFNLFALNIHEDPSATQGIARRIASDMPEYSIIIRKDPKVEAYFKSRFARSYESVREKAGRIFNISRYYNSFRRIDEYNERGIYVQVLTPTPLSMGSVTVTDPLGAFERWMFWSAKRGLSGDLTALPLFGDVKYLGRAIWIGRDRHDRDIYFFPEAMPALHALFYGKTGMGKSWTVATLLLRLKRSGYNVRFTIIDPHGDYIKLRDLLGANVVIIGKKDYIDIFSDVDEKVNKLAAKLAHEELNEPMDLEQIKDYYSNLLVGKGVPIIRSKDYIIAFSEKARNDPSFMYIYGSLLVHQLYRHAFDVIREGSNDVWIIVLDEAYLFLNEKILRNLMLGARKFGVAVWLVVHEPGFLTDAVMSSTTLKVILGGEGVPEMLRGVLKLSSEEEDWLRTARSPLELGGRAQAIVVHGPSDVRYIGYVELEKEVKRR